MHAYIWNADHLAPIFILVLDIFSTQENPIEHSEVSDRRTLTPTQALSLALFLAPRRLFPDETRRPDVLTPRDHWLVHDIKPISSLRCLQLLTFRILTKTVNAVTIEFFLYLLLKTGSRTSDVDFQFFIQVIAFFLSTYLRIKISTFLEIM